MCPMGQPAVVNTATPNISNGSPPVSTGEEKVGGGKEEERIRVRGESGDPIIRVFVMSVG